MPNVDFTLDDVRRVVSEDIRAAVDIRFNTIDTRFDTLETRFDNLEMRFDKLEIRFDQFDQRFAKFETNYENDMRAIQDDLTVIITRLDGLESQAKITNRIIGQHSKDIMQLRAATGL